MHRVELKVSSPLLLYAFSMLVPNAPCGVERFCGLLRKRKFVWFLMHRVELKVVYGVPGSGKTYYGS